MDKIQKALAKLSERERRWVKEILQQLFEQNERGLNIQKLKGHRDIFRVRKGDVRIIVRRDSGGSLFVLTIERRSEKTYRNF